PQCLILQYVITPPFGFAAKDDFVRSASCVLLYYKKERINLGLALFDAHLKVIHLHDFASTRRMNREVSFYDSEPNQHLNKPRFVFPAKATRRERQAGAFNLVNGMFLTWIWDLVREWLVLSTRQRDKLKTGILAGQLLSGETPYDQAPCQLESALVCLYRALRCLPDFSPAGGLVYRAES